MSQRSRRLHYSPPPPSPNLESHMSKDVGLIMKAHDMSVPARCPRQPLGGGASCDPDGSWAWSVSGRSLAKSACGCWLGAAPGPGCSRAPTPSPPPPPPPPPPGWSDRHSVVIHHVHVGLAQPGGYWSTETT